MFGVIWHRMPQGGGGDGGITTPIEIAAKIDKNLGLPRHMPRSVALAIYTLALAGCVSTGADYGGRIQSYSFEARLAAARGEPIRITSECYSACTLKLLSPTTCVTRGARLGFHSASGDGWNLPAWNAYMLLHYPPALAAHLRNIGAMERAPLTYLSGGDVIALGAKECMQ